MTTWTARRLYVRLHHARFGSRESPSTTGPTDTTALDPQRWWALPVLYFDPDTTNGVLIHLTQLPARPNTVGFGQGVQVDKIIHAGYLVRNAAEAVAWYVDKFDGVHVGGRAMRRGGRYALVNCGQVQVELIELQDPSTMGAHHAMDHVGYVTQDMGAGITECFCRGFRFEADAPSTNAIGHQVLYFDPNTSMGSRMHLTQLPA